MPKRVCGMRWVLLQRTYLYRSTLSSVSTPILILTILQLELFESPDLKMIFNLLTVNGIQLHILQIPIVTRFSSSRHAPFYFSYHFIFSLFLFLSVICTRSEFLIDRYYCSQNPLVFIFQF